MSMFSIVAENGESTVVTEYFPSERKSESYQSEAELEAEFIRLLCEQGYEYLKIHTESQLIENLRRQIEKLNGISFSATEWARFYGLYLSNMNEGIEEKTLTIQRDSVKTLARDDGSTKNVRLIDKKNIHNNFLQVINQYQDNEGSKKSRYDVTILVNGLPLVHVELKRRGVSIRNAFDQIERYQRESFWKSSGLFEFVQIFIISNGTNTKYYSNTTRFQAEKEHNSSPKKKGRQTSNSFEFTSFWADGKNKIIPDLVDFTKTFLAKHTILNVLTKYCVFTSENMLLVMRPYQITATERILNRIEISTNYKKFGTTDAGGYIWHTTGSGKTLTSFKTAVLASKLDYIDKVLFVVDRKDLDYQTMKEYDRFQKDAANSNTSTEILRRQLNSNDDSQKIIITTIQKLSSFIKKYKKDEANNRIFSQHVVLVFDECHRSQFGEMHVAITKSFKKYHIFGFTGTPILSENANMSLPSAIKTTEQAFGDKLHTYTIVDAIKDGNVLPFLIDYVATVQKKDSAADKKVSAIDTEKALLSDDRISKITGYILSHFSQKTKRDGENYKFNRLSNIAEVASSKNRMETAELKNSVHLRGFNSIFAVSSIEAAKKYYLEFKNQQENLPESERLKVGTIYSYGTENSQNEESDDFVADENCEDTEGLDKNSREFLDSAIADYNKMFETNYDTSSQNFQNYYKDVSLRMKNKDLDLLIVVNMFLTGFDATTLNTLWVDKNLKYHGLVQAFSRTNRILNSVKKYGNIVCFRDLEKATDEAIAMFGNKDAGGIVLLKSFESYYYGYDDDSKTDLFGEADSNNHHAGYAELVEKLLKKFPIGGELVGEGAQKDFIRTYSHLLRLKNLLSSFDAFDGKEILTERQFQDYQGKYIDLYDEYRKRQDGKTDKKEIINEDVEFEIDLIKQVEVNIDYILERVKKQQIEGDIHDKEFNVSIEKDVNSTLSLRSKLTLILDFIKSINPKSDVDSDWRSFVDKMREKELCAIIKEENLKERETREFVEDSFRSGFLRTSGIDLDAILPAVSRFGTSGSNRTEIKHKVIERLSVYFEKYSDLVILTKRQKMS
mgnify:CR=1 FL=1